MFFRSLHGGWVGAIRLVATHNIWEVRGPGTLTHDLELVVPRHLSVGKSWKMHARRHALAEWLCYLQEYCAAMALDVCVQLEAIALRLEAAASRMEAILSVVHWPLFSVKPKPKPSWYTSWIGSEQWIHRRRPTETPSNRWRKVD